MFYSARARAAELGLAFDLSLKDIVVPERCPALGILLQPGKGVLSHASPSLDRINPEAGYVRGNVRVISYRANTIKSNATADEIEAVARYVRQAGLEKQTDG